MSRSPAMTSLPLTSKGEIPSVFAPPEEDTPPNPAIAALMAESMAAQSRRKSEALSSPFSTAPLNIPPGPIDTSWASDSPGQNGPSARRKSHNSARPTKKAGKDVWSNQDAIAIADDAAAAEGSQAGESQVDGQEAAETSSVKPGKASKPKGKKKEKAPAKPLFSVSSPAPSESSVVPSGQQDNADNALVAGSEAGPSTSTAPRRSHKKLKKASGTLLAYTTAFVPGMYNIKNPAGDFAQKDSNVEVFRQVSLARKRAEKQAAEEARQKAAEAGETVSQENPLSNILIIHPGSRNLRIGRASDFYPKEIPNCIARPSNAPGRGSDPPVPGSRATRISAELAERRESKRRKGDNGEVLVNGKENGHAAAGTEDEGDIVDPVDTNIGYLRDYLREKLRANRLSTDYREGTRVKAFNAKVKPEPIPEHNDPYRFDWTEVEGKPFVVGTEALRLPPSAGFSLRWPILQRGLNLRDWPSPQSLMDDIAVILQEAMRTELGILPKDYAKFSVVFIVPDHGDRLYVQEMTHLLLAVMGFKEIAVHQEAYTAIFSAGLSTACVVDIGAQTTSITCVDEGFVNSDTRVELAYGGDDITIVLAALLQRSSFPYRELDLAKAQDWIMFDNLKIRICTLEEHLVANTPWDFFVLRPEGLTQKYLLRTYDENILAPLCFFDTRLIDFKEKKGDGKVRSWGNSEDVDDLLTTAYDEATGAMRSCASHLFPAAPAPIAIDAALQGVAENGEAKEAASVQANGASNGDAEGVTTTTGPANGESADKPNGSQAPTADMEATESKPVDPAADPAVPSAEAAATNGDEAEPTPPEIPDEVIIAEASHSPLDGAIAASIAMCGTENKVKAAAGTILLIGGGSALKGLNAFLTERIPPLIRAKGFPISEISIVPPPRNLNPRLVSWKGASVMCNLESLSDMWIGRDEWDAIGARSLKDRCLFF